MTKPSKSEATKRVAELISVYSNYNKEIKESYVLKENPLMMDNTQLSKLTLALRAYVQLYDEAETVYVKEIRKTGLKVSDVNSLIHKKLGL